MLYAPTRVNNIIGCMLSMEKDVMFCEVGEKLGKSDHSIIRFTVSFRFDLKVRFFNIENMLRDVSKVE